MNDSELTDPDSGVDLKTKVVQESEELRAAAGAKARQFAKSVERQAGEVSDAATDKADQLRKAAETGWEEAKVRVQDLFQEGDAYVRENPGKSVVTALGVGFVLGLLFRR